MTLKWKIRKFLNSWRCQRNPDKETFGWNYSFRLLDYGLSSSRTFNFPDLQADDLLEVNK